MQFFGRTEEIKRLQNQLSAVQSQHESRMVCLMGPSTGRKNNATAESL